MGRVDEAVGVGAPSSVVTSAPGVSAWISVTGWRSGDSTSAPGVGGGSKTTGGEGNSAGVDGATFATSTLDIGRYGLSF